MALRDGGKLYYLLGDHLGSTSVTVDSNGVRQGELWYKAWGETRGTAFQTTPTHYRFTGQRAESDLKLYWMGFRMYDPVLGRFIQADTIVPEPGNPQDLNRYAYCRNNPLRYSDPSGNTPWDLVDVAFFVWSAKDFVQNPSWANAGWMVADALSVLPVIPSTGWVRRSAQVLFQASNAVDGAGDIARFVGKFTTRAPEGSAAYDIVQRVAREAEENIIAKGVAGSLEAAQEAAAKGDEILPGLFKYTGKTEIQGYAQHHLWPQAFGGPLEGWTVFAKQPHQTLTGIQGRLNTYLKQKLGKAQRELEQWARENPNQILPHLRDFYQGEGIPFPY